MSLRSVYVRLHYRRHQSCEFPKCGNLDCIIYGTGGLRSRSPLEKLVKQSRSVFIILLDFFSFFFICAIFSDVADRRGVLSSPSVSGLCEKSAAPPVMGNLVEISHRPHFYTRLTVDRL